MYDHYFSNFSRPPDPDDLCKDSAKRHPWFWRRRFLNVFTIYGHGGHLGQWTATIITIFHSLTPGRLQMEFEQHRLRGSRREVICNFQHFSHTNAYGSKHKASSVLEKKIFIGFYHIWAWLPSWSRTAAITAIYRSPNLKKLHMKSEQNWLRGFRGEVVWKC